MPWQRLTAGELVGFCLANQAAVAKAKFDDGFASFGANQGGFFGVQSELGVFENVLEVELHLTGATPICYRKVLGRVSTLSCEAVNVNRSPWLRLCPGVASAATASCGFAVEGCRVALRNTKLL
jgi:hypothetical protein